MSITCTKHDSTQPPHKFYVSLEQFLAGTDPNTAFIFWLLAFAAGFNVRSFGALVFGRLGATTDVAVVLK